MKAAEENNPRKVIRISSGAKSNKMFPNCVVQTIVLSEAKESQIYPIFWYNEFYAGK
jgi:hypothetical protein